MKSADKQLNTMGFHELIFWLLDNINHMFLLFPALPRQSGKFLHNHKSESSQRAKHIKKLFHTVLFIKPKNKEALKTTVTSWHRWWKTIFQFSRKKENCYLKRRYQCLCLVVKQFSVRHRRQVKLNSAVTTTKKIYVVLQFVEISAPIDFHSRLVSLRVDGSRNWNMSEK